MTKQNPKPMAGIHHITAIAGPAKRNYDFYTGLLGLRMVKKTINFDDPKTYHLYYGNQSGNPGTIVTLFPWEQTKRGQWGSGCTKTTRLGIPEGSRKNWAVRLEEADYPFESAVTPFGEDVIRFEDPDGLLLELIETDEAPDSEVFTTDEIGEDMAIRSCHSVTLALRDTGSTARLLGMMGFDEIAREGHHFRYRSESGTYARTIELEQFRSHESRQGAGVMHHIAFRVKNSGDQLKWRKFLTELGFQVTEVRNRNYFESIYFREPGGVLFEIATDPPGFAVDESVDSLGSSLKMPEWLEERREEIEAQLPALE